MTVDMPSRTGLAFVKACTVLDPIAHGDSNSGTVKRNEMAGQMGKPGERFDRQVSERA